MSDTTNIIAEGEVEQLARAGDPDATEAQYTQIIGKKTAVLFAAAAEGAAILAGAAPGTRAAMRDYGMNLGLAFQLIDDVLDYTGDPQAMGKNLGDDLAEGKPTLPLIHAIAHAAPAAATVVRQAILGRDRDALADIVATVQSCGALDYTRRRAVHHRDLALAALDNVADSAFRQNLETIARMTVDRAS